MNTAYDPAFFDGQAAGSLQSARAVLGRLFPILQPRRVLDVGCGVGSWLRASLELGAAEVVGVDGDYVDPDVLMISPQEFIPADLSRRRLGDILGEHARTPFDLVLCMEVAEHLPHARAVSLVEDLAACSDVVLFSAAVPFQYGTDHINEQWPEFWAILFRSQGFDCFDFLRNELWADAGTEWWYAQNALVFARKGSEASARLPHDALVAGRGLARVHPENLLANLLGLPRRHRHAASVEEVADLRALVAANVEGSTTVPPLSALARADAADPDARDVFPWTRNDIAQPEQDIARLARQVADLTQALSTERTLRQDEETRRQAIERTLEEEKRLREKEKQRREQEERLRDRAQKGVRHYSSLAFAVQQQLQAEAAKRQDAENRVATALAEQRLAEDAKRNEIEALHASLADCQFGQAAALAQLQSAQDDLGAAAAELQALRASTLWRATAPLRVVGRRMPGPLRRVMRGPVRIAWRALRGGPMQAPVPAQVPALPLPSDAEEHPRLVPSDAAEHPRMPEMASEPAASPEKPELKRYGQVLGSVNWWTLAGATARLRRFEPFDAEDYLRRNPDIEAAGVDPYAHFIQSGAFEERGRIDPERLARVMSGCMFLDHAERAAPPDVEDEPGHADPGIGDVRIGVYVSSHGNVFMEEIAGHLAADLRSVGAAVEMLDENASIDDRPPICIYVAPHEFFILGRGPEWMRDDVFADGFMLGTEQVQTSWFNKALPIILLSRGMLDLCSQTADLFARTGMAALHLLPGIRTPPQRLTEQDRQHPLFRVLPVAAQRDPDFSSTLASRPIDIAFFGHSSRRRDQFFARNAGFFADYETFNYCRRSGRGPIRGEGNDGALTRIAGHVSGHAKITLNIHREEFGYFEWHRMVRLGMCSGSVMVSDPCLPHPNFLANEHYFQERARHIPDLLEWLLRTEDGMREAERVRNNADRLITSDFETKHATARLLRFLAKHRLRTEDASQGQPQE